MTQEIGVLSIIFMLGTIFFNDISSGSRFLRALFLVPISFVSYLGYIAALAIFGGATAGHVSWILLFVPAIYLIFKIKKLKFDWRFTSATTVSFVILTLAFSTQFRTALFTPDSFSILANAEMLRDGSPVSFGRGDEVLKRGLTLPMIHSLMPADNFSIALAPMLSIFSLMLIMGIIYECVERLNWPKVSIIYGLIALTGFASTFQFRSNFTYVNTHSLMAIAILGILSIGLLSTNQELGEASLLAIVGMGIALSLSRAEGYLIYLVLISAFLPTIGQSKTVILRVMSIPLIFSSIWNLKVFYSEPALLMPLLLFLASIIGTALLILATWQKFEALVTNLLIVQVALLIIFTMGSVLRKSGSLLESMTPCLINAQRYWGEILPILLATTVLVAIFSRRDSISYKFAMTAISLTLLMFITKSFDGGLSSQMGICRVGWGDSINRGWIHYVGLFVVVFALGFSNRPEKQRAINRNDDQQLANKR
jgi:hypothetical protein